MDIGYSPLSERVYIGRINKKKGTWVGEKKDITNDFIQVMFQKFPENTMQQITSNGKPTHRIFIVDIDKEVVIDGKIIK